MCTYGAYAFLHDAVHLRGREVVKHRPFQLISGEFTPADFQFLRENALMGHAQHDTFFRAAVVGGVQIVNKHQVGHLLDHVQRIGDTARPKRFPKAVDFIF